MGKIHGEKTCPSTQFHTLLCKGGKGEHGHMQKTPQRKPQAAGGGGMRPLSAEMDLAIARQPAGLTGVFKQLCLPREHLPKSARMNSLTGTLVEP